MDIDILSQALGDLEIRFSNAVVSERIRMGEEVERLRGQVGALRREVWLSRRQGGMELSVGGQVGAQVGGHTHGEIGPPGRLSDATTKQIVKL